MLCGMGAVVFSVAAGTSRRSGIWAVALFCAGVVWTGVHTIPTPEVIGCAAAIGATAFVFRPAWTTTAAGLGLECDDVIAGREIRHAADDNRRGL